HRQPDQPVADGHRPGRRRRFLERQHRFEPGVQGRCAASRRFERQRADDHGRRDESRGRQYRQLRGGPRPCGLGLWRRRRRHHRLSTHQPPHPVPTRRSSKPTDSLISLWLTVTDKDGDAVSSSVNIASNLTFKDDAPHLGASSGSEPTITVDETNLAVDNTGDFAAVLGLAGSGYGADGAGTTVCRLTNRHTLSLPDALPSPPTA